MIKAEVWLLLVTFPIIALDPGGLFFAGRALLLSIVKSKAWLLMQSPGNDEDVWNWKGNEV